MYVPKFKGMYHLDVYTDNLNIVERLKRIGLRATLETERSDIVFRAKFEAHNEKDLLNKKHMYQDVLGETPSVVKRIGE